MEVRETTLTFPVARGSGPMTGNRTLVYPRQINNAVAAIRGYQIGFASDDHHVGLLEVGLDTTVDQNAVTVTGRLGCRDWSGTWDDDYGGSIQVVVLADMVPISEPPPRGDLSIQDLEVNQATQFFRSADHLDASNVRPDNSLPLVAGKSTGLRAYVDYDADAGLPPISSLTGELIVTSRGAQSTLTPLAVITPRRSIEIERGSVGHTLNFVIPGVWCDGEIDVRLRVFDSTAPDQKSAAFRRTLRFVRVNPLRIYGVGVHYSGAGVDLPPPELIDFAATFDYTRRVWPTGDLLFSGYTTLDFDRDLSGTASEGCGSGFESLLDDLRDIKGDTDDLVYGLLPTGTPLTGVGGCGGDGVGTGMIGAGVTAAHEAGHAFGRDHAPCDDSGRCDSPRNTDDSFPHYGSYPSDSVGEFGFDAENNVVFDPAPSSDFMGYSANDWISPYTYAAVFAAGDPSPSSGAEPGWIATYLAAPSAEHQGVPHAGSHTKDERAEWLKKREPVLFLRVTADLDEETAIVHPSFTYSAMRRPRGLLTTVEAHVLGENGEMIACTYLRRACGSCDWTCGPADLVAQVPLLGRPHTLVIRASGKVLATEEFERPVKLKCDWRTVDDGKLALEWQGRGTGKGNWYLVQWQDRDGVWRGAAPRTRETSLILPARLRAAAKDFVNIRVLATELLTTSSCQLQFEGHHMEPSVDITVYETGAAIHALTADSLGRQVPGRLLTWYDDRGGEILSGEQLPKALLSAGTLQGSGIHVAPTGLGVTRSEGGAVIEAGALFPESSRSGGEPDHQHPHPHPRPDVERNWRRANPE